MTTESKDTVATPFDLIDDLLEKPYWVIDLLPSQVPAEGEGQFFAVERVFLEGSHRSSLRQKFADTLLMLNCYHDLVVYRGEDDEGVRNPKPQTLEKWVARGEDNLCIILPSQNALLVVPTDGTCMALYQPEQELLDQVRLIASACGLFVWQPPR